MTYSVKEMFLTLQGEGVHAGRRAVFVRFAGCNLWTGREVDRATAICRFCDTDFVGTDGVGGGKFADAALLAAVGRLDMASLGIGGAPYDPTRNFDKVRQGYGALVDPLAGALDRLNPNGALVTPDSHRGTVLGPLKADAESLQK
jgi:hypothetical protein